MNGQEQSLEQCQLAAALLDGGLVIADEHIVYANHSAAQLLGSSAASLMGAAAASLFSLADGETVSAWLIERNGETCEELVHRRDGDSFPARVGIAALDSERTRFAVSIQDITEARKLAATLDQELVAFERRRAELLATKQETIRALSMPVLQVWEGVLAIPLVGALDQQRISDTTERLLFEVVRCSARFVIIDLTGLDAVDAASASHLARMIGALALIGSGCVISGIRPALARTFVDRDINIAHALCFATQHEALTAVLELLGWSVARGHTRPARAQPRGRL